MKEEEVYEKIKDFLSENFTSSDYLEILHILGEKNDIEVHNRDASTGYSGWRLKWDRLKNNYMQETKKDSLILKELDYMYVYIGFYLFNEKNYKINHDLFQSANTMIKRDINMSQTLLNNIGNPFYIRFNEYFCQELDPYEVVNVI